LETSLESLKVKLYADGADISEMLEMASQPHISGLTTNPTLMRKAGVKNYSEFAKLVLKHIDTKPISFEVFSDDLSDMVLQAEKIASWGENVFVKIPITNTLGESTVPVISYLTRKKIKVNVTAITNIGQLSKILDALNPEIESNISIFAGRIADTGTDPVPVMENCLQVAKGNLNAKLIWASPRELLNIFQADSIGCHIITATNDILRKLNLIGYDLNEYSLDTVKMFYEDAKASGFKID